MRASGETMLYYIFTLGTIVIMKILNELDIMYLSVHNKESETKVIVDTCMDRYS